MDKGTFQSPRVESEFDHEWPCPLLVLSRSKNCQVHQNDLLSWACLWRLSNISPEALLHGIDSNETLVEGEG